MDAIQPDTSNGSKMPKWAVALIVVLALLFVIQSTVIVFHFSQKPKQKVAETVVHQTVPAAQPLAGPQSSALRRQRLSPAAWQTQQTQAGANTGTLWNDPFFDDAFSSIGRLSQHMSSLFEQMASLPAMDASFMPAIDIGETKAAYIVRSDVPGLDKDKINVTVRGNMLTLQGVRETGSETKDEKAGYYSQERSYGSFSRSVMLPGPVDEANIKADYKNGVLTITLPKTNPDKEASKIPVQ